MADDSSASFGTPTPGIGSPRLSKETARSGGPGGAGGAPVRKSVYSVNADVDEEEEEGVDLLFLTLRFLFIVFALVGWFFIIMWALNSRLEPTNSALRGPQGKVAAIVMVKNEQAALPRLLASLREVVDFVFVCDTGSTDATRQIAENNTFVRVTAFRYVGEFHDFETSRNLCMDAARAMVPESIEWILLPDADFTLSRPAGAGGGELPLPEYDINIVRIEPVNGGGGTQNALPLLVRRSVFFNNCRYRLWTHEILDCCATLGGIGYYSAPGVYFVDHSDGSNRVTKVERDIRLLTEWLRLYRASRGESDWREDLWARALYYLARAHEDAGHLNEALTLYEEHQEVQPWTNYRFYGRYRMALIDLQQYRERNQTEGWREVETSFVRAIGAPFGDGLFRREPFYYLTWMHCELHHWERCWTWAQAALATPPIDYSRMPLFLEPSLFDETWFRGMAERATREIKTA